MSFNDDIDQKLQQVEEIKQTMFKNAELAALRGDSIENIHDKSIILSDDAEDFRRKGVQMKGKMCRQYWKSTIYIFLICIILLIIIILSIYSKN